MGYYGILFLSGVGILYLLKSARSSGDESEPLNNSSLTLPKKPQAKKLFKKEAWQKLDEWFKEAKIKAASLDETRQVYNKKRC